MSGHKDIVYNPETQGAWKFGKYRLMWPRMGYFAASEEKRTFDQIRVNGAIYGIQNMLNAQGFYDPTFAGATGIYDYETYVAVKRLQRDAGIRPRDRDGQVGLSVMALLCEERIGKMERVHGIPGEVVAGQFYWEAAWDPAAVGFLHPQDWGLGQFNMDVGDMFKQMGYGAFVPVIAIKETAKRLGDRYRANLEKTDDIELALNCAVAAHNSPVDATAWLESGSPPDEQIATYVARIRNQYAEGYGA